MSWFRRTHDHRKRFLDLFTVDDTFFSGSPSAGIEEYHSRRERINELESRLQEAHRRSIAAEINPDGTRKGNAGLYDSLWHRAVNLAVAEYGYDITHAALQKMSRYRDADRLRREYGN